MTWAKRIALFLTSLVATLLLVDTALRPILRTRTLVRPTLLFRERWSRDPDVFRYQCDQFFAGEIHGDLAAMLPGAKHAERRSVVFQTDHLGFRNAPPDHRIPARFLVLGDSFAAGSGGSQEFTISRQISQQLDAPAINLGIGGADPRQELLTFQYALQDIVVGREPSLIWLLFAGNDLYGNSGRTEMAISPVPRQLLTKLENWSHRSLLLELLARHGRNHGTDVRIVEIDGHYMLFYEPYIREMSLAPPLVLERFERLEGILNTMLRTCRGQGIAVHLVLVPSKEQTYQWLLQDPGVSWGSMHAATLSRQLSEWSIQNKVLFLDLTDAFRKEARIRWLRHGRTLYWFDDSHWNHDGQIYASQLIAGFVTAGDPAISR